MGVGVLLLVVASVSQAQNARIVLRWKDVPGASAYELQIAKDPAFVEIVLQTRTTSRRLPLGTAAHHHALVAGAQLRRREPRQ